jgi:uncharacterized membrane protein SirB2
MLRALTFGAYYITVGLMVTLRKRKRKRKRKFISFLNFLVYGIAEKDTKLQLNIFNPKNTHTVSQAMLVHSF